MVRTFCTSGESEVVKGSVHAAGGLLAVAMAAYNIAAWCYRRERHLGVNAVVYTLATLWEVKQTAHHFDRLDCFHRMHPAAEPDAQPDAAPRAA
jgi:hypothetical protein